MKFAEFKRGFAKRMKGPLVALGFKKRSDKLFVRFNETHEINVISIQKHSVKPAVCVNLGVHYDFFPKDGTSELESESNFDLIDCMLKFRLTPDPSKSDHWWVMESKSIEKIAELIESRVESFFDRYKIDGPISSIVVDDLKDNKPHVLDNLTKVGACWILARIQEELGNVESAVAFARYGLEVAEMKVGIKMSSETF